jgi:hypothetical protein
MYACVFSCPVGMRAHGASVYVCVCVWCCVCICAIGVCYQSLNRSLGPWVVEGGHQRTTGDFNITCWIVVFMGMYSFAKQQTNDNVEI